MNETPTTETTETEKARIKDIEAMRAKLEIQTNSEMIENYILMKNMLTPDEEKKLLNMGRHVWSFVGCGLPAKDLQLSERQIAKFMGLGLILLLLPHKGNCLAF